MTDDAKRDDAEDEKVDEEKDEDEAEADGEKDADVDEPAEADAAPPPPPAPEPAKAEERSWGFPSFARDFPRDAELDALVAKYADGDYLAVREGAPRLAAKDDVSDGVKKAALLLRARVEPDRTARTFFALAAALLAFLTLWWATHDGPEHRGTIPPPPAPAVEFVK